MSSSEAEGLDDVVVGAELEAEHSLALVASSRDDDDRNRRLGSDSTADFGAVHVGKPEVEQYQIGSVEIDEARPRPSRRGWW